MCLMYVAYQLPARSGSFNDSTHRRSYKKLSKKIRTSTAANPTAEYLFETRAESDAKFIPNEQPIQFHHNVAKLLFVRYSNGSGISNYES